jgi:hypothetical protein
LFIFPPLLRRSVNNAAGKAVRSLEHRATFGLCWHLFASRGLRTFSGDR